MQYSPTRGGVTFVAALLLAGSALFVMAAPAAASPAGERHDALAELPHCDAPHGSIVIKEAGEDWWTPLGLPSPEAVLKLYVMKSGCFKILDRGKGFALAQRERELADSGEINDPAKLAKGQIEAADYALVPDLLSKNADSSGSGLTAVAGWLMGGPIGNLVSSIKVSSKTADVALTLSDIRTLEQKAATDGHAEHTDWSFGVGGGFANWKSAFGIDVGAYENTEVGQVIMVAYLNAYAKMLRDLDYKTEVATPLPLEGKEIALTP